MELTNAHVVVTGAAGGIGAALVRRFVAEGARVVVAADIAPPTVEHPAGVVVERCDVTNPNEIRGLIDRAEHTNGPIDLFCSNAGIIGGIGLDAPDEVWQTTIEVNVMSHVWAARVLIPRMIERGGGYFLHTASAAGLLTQLGSATYSVTKHGAIAFAEWISITYGDHGIGVSVLCPQAVRTNMTAGTVEGGVAGVDGMIEPDDVASAAVEGLADERFLILPHPVVGDYFRRKADDYDRWLRGMRRLQARFPSGF